MKLQIEKWLDRYSYSINVRNLFRESILCYKIGAYRASLLYSYLAFLTILKERLIISNMPSNFPQGRWDDIIKNIQKESRWEETLFDATQNATNIIFQIPEHIRLQIKYWKDRRNDSAHYKDNIINEHHVESFWSFFQSNILKITVEGGKDNLLKKFDKHFDPTRTRPETSFLVLIQEISESVEASEFASFLNELYQLNLKYTYQDDAFLKICKEAVPHLPDNYNEKIFDYLKTTGLYVEMILQQPSTVQYFSFKPEEIRQLWSSKLKVSPRTLDLFGALLRNNLIPKEEMSEANNRFLILGLYPPESPDNDEELWRCGFYEELYDKYFVDGGLYSYKSVNARFLLIMHYIKKRSMTSVMVERICLAFNRVYHSYHLSDELNKFFDEQPKIKEYFINEAESKNWPLPKYIPTLLDNY